MELPRPTANLNPARPTATDAPRADWKPLVRLPAAPYLTAKLTVYGTDYRAPDAPPSDAVQCL